MSDPDPIYRFTSRLLVVAALGLAAPAAMVLAQEPNIAPPGALTLENIPPIPQRLAAEVQKYIELAAQGGSREPGIFISLAGTYIEVKKFQEALNLLERPGGLEGAKTHPYYNALAYAYEGLNDFPKAYESLKTGLTVRAPRPVLAATSKHLGFVCFELKRYKEAETYLGYTLKAGLDCPECGLLLTTIRGALEELDDSPAPMPRKKRK